MGDAEPDTRSRLIASEARDRVRFEEEALDFADQALPGVARRLVGTSEEAEDLCRDVREGLPQLAELHTGNEHARLAPSHPHQPERRPRPPQTARSRLPATSRRATTTSKNRLAQVAGEEVLDQERSSNDWSQDGIVDRLAIPTISINTMWQRYEWRLEMLSEHMPSSETLPAAIRRASPERRYRDR